MTAKKKQKKGKSKKTMVRLGAPAIAALSGFAAYQAGAVNVTLPIIARLVRAIDLTINTSMDFGTLAMTIERAGAATLDPGLNRLVIDGGALTLAGGKPTAGILKVKGAEFPVAISVENTTVKLTNGTGTVVVGNFNLLTAKGGTKMTFTPTQNTYAFTVPIGATIQTRPGQISGTYVGAMRIFASYQ